MPFYTFYCPICKATFDEILSMNEDAKQRKCLKCGSESKRYYGESIPIIFKGEGFTRSSSQT